MSKPIKLTTPLSDEDIMGLKSGNNVLISGVLYTARDAAHKRMIQLLQRGEKLPLDLQGQVIYYTGPSPARPERVIGSAGPTTSYRMDPYTVPLLAQGLKGMIGKGGRSQHVREAIRKYGAVYFAATGGAGALLAKSIINAQIIAYEDLGPEAVRRIEVKNLPAIVVNDIYGNDLYEEGVKKYRRGAFGAVK